MTTDARAWVRTTCTELLGLGSPVPLDVAPLELGMNSLVAVRLAARLSSEFDTDVNPAAVLRATSLGDLAEGLVARTTQQLQVDHDAFVPFTDMQTSFYIADQLAPGTSAFHCPLVWKLDGQVNSSVLDHALRDMALRHPLWRGTLDYDDDRLGLRIAPTPFDRLRRARAADEAEALALVEESIAAPFFDRPGEPLWRALLVDHGTPEHPRQVFAVVNHHVLVDWIAAQVLIRDLSRFYVQRETGDYPVVTRTPVGHVLGLRRERDEAAAAEGLGRWGEALRDVPAPALSTGGARRHDVTEIPARVVERLREAAPGLRTTLHNLLLACFAEAFHAWSGQDDVTVGVSYAFPRDEYAQTVCAPLMNTLPVRTRRTRPGDLLDMTGQATRAVMDAMLHSDVPVGRLAAAAEAGRRGAPLFDVAFSFQEHPFPTLDLGGESKPLLLPVDPMFPIVFAAGPHGDAVRVSATSALADGTAQDCAELLTAFRTVCEDFASQI